MKTRKPKIVVLRRSYDGMKANHAYVLIGSFWRDGEGWYCVKDDAGKTFECPDIFFDDVWVGKK